MMRTTRPGARAAVVAVLVSALAGSLVAAFSFSGPAEAAGHGTKLSYKIRYNVAASAHPYLRRACDGELAVGERGIRTTAEKGKHTSRVIVATTTCYGATAATPMDIGVYDTGGRELYLLDRGRSFHRGKRWVTAVSAHEVRAGTVAVVYAGYLPSDPMCCASRLYERIFHLHHSGATHGKLHRVPKF